MVSEERQPLLDGISISRGAPHSSRGTPFREDEVLAGAKRADNPLEEMPERNNHGKNIIGTIEFSLCAKSFILQVYDVLARHRFC